MNGQKSNWILNFLLVFLVLALGLGIVPMFLGAVNPDFRNTWYGFRPYIVISDSMEPDIMTGALVIGRVTPFADLEVGDDITFEMMLNGELVFNTHRIVERRAYEVITQGVNLSMPDPDPVTQHNFRYRVVWHSNTIQLGSTRGIMLFVVLPAGGLLLLVIAVAALSAVLRRKRNDVVPLALPEYPTEAEHEQQSAQQRSLQVPTGEWLPTPKDVNIEDDELSGLIEHTLKPSPTQYNDEDDYLLALLDNALGSRNNKEENEWFDILMRQKGILLPR